MGGGEGEGRPAPRGPLQRRVLQLLAEGFPGHEFVTGLADRSTLGPCTITVRPLSREVELDDLAAWLQGRESVDVVAVKKSDLHLRLKTEVLREWVGEGWREALAAPVHELPSVTVAVPEETTPCSLERGRKAVVARSVAVLLEQQGHAVEVTASADEDAWLWGADASSGPQRIEVAEVDVKHDRMRARHGGIVTLENLRDDVREDAIALEGRKRDDRFADALISFLMTHERRKRRLGMDNDKAGRKIAELDEILGRRVEAREKSGAEGAGESELSAEADATVCALIAQIEAAPDVTAHAARVLDPAPVNRLIRSLAEALGAVEGLPAGDPLWDAPLEALENAMRVVAPGLDQAQAQPPASKSP